MIRQRRTALLCFPAPLSRLVSDRISRILASGYRQEQSLSTDALTPVSPRTTIIDVESKQQVVSLSEHLRRRALMLRVVTCRPLREVSSRLKNIRMSPWKINLLVRQIRGLPVVEALMQLKFSRKQKGPPIVAKVIQNAANLADIRYRVKPEDLMIAEAFTNQSFIQKGWLAHGKGYTGLKLRRYSAVIVRLKQIDFEEAIKQCKNRFQLARWNKRKHLAEAVRESRKKM